MAPLYPSISSVLDRARRRSRRCRRRSKNPTATRREMRETKTTPAMMRGLARPSSRLDLSASDVTRAEAAEAEAAEATEAADEEE